MNRDLRFDDVAQESLPTPDEAASPDSNPGLERRTKPLTKGQGVVEKAQTFQGFGGADLSGIFPDMPQLDPTRVTHLKQQVLFYGGKYTTSDAEAEVIGGTLASLELASPELRQMLDDDFERAMRMTDTESIDASIEHARTQTRQALGTDPFRGSSMLDPEAVINETAEYYSDIARFVKSTDDMVRMAELDLTTSEEMTRSMVKEATARAASEVFAEHSPAFEKFAAEVEAKWATLDITTAPDAEFPTLNLGEMEFKHNAFSKGFQKSIEDQLTLSSDNLRGRELAYSLSADGRQLVISLAAENANADVEGQPDELMFFQNIVLDPGTTINSEMDAVVELLKAEVGLHHTVIEADEFPGQQTLAGRVIEAAGATIGEVALGSHADPLWSIVEKAKRETASLIYPKGEADAAPAAPDVDAIREAYVNDRVTPDVMVASWAMIKIEENPGLSAGEALAESRLGWDAYSDAEKNALITETREMLDEQVKEGDLLEVAEELLDERSVGERLLDDSFGMILTTFEGWDQIVHQLFMSAVDVGVTVAGDPLEAALGTINDAWGNWVNDLQDKDPDDYAYASEYFGVPDSHKVWGFWLDMVVSLAFDPINYMTSSASAATRANIRMFTNPETLARAVQAPHFKRLARIAEALDPHQRVRLFGGQGMSGDHLLQIATASGADILKIMGEAIPGARKGGLFIPKPGFHLSQRNSMIGLARAVEKTNGRQKGPMRSLQALFTNASPDRSVSLGKDVMDDALRFMDVLYLNAPQDEYMKALTTLVDTYKETYTSREARRVVARKQFEWHQTQLEDLKAKYPAHVRGLPSQLDNAVELEKVIDSFENELRRLGRVTAKTDGDRARMTALADDLDVANRKLKQLQDKKKINPHVQAQFDEYDEAYQALKAEGEELTDLLRRVDGPPNRWGLQDWWNQQYRAWAVRQRGGVEFADDAEYKEFWRELRERMGHETWEKGGDSPDDMWAFFSHGNKEVEDLMRQGVNQVPGQMVLPASPADLVGYEAGFKAAKPKSLQGRFSHAGNTLHLFFVTNVLTNPMTILRSNLDDPLRQAISYGVRGGTKTSGLTFNAAGDVVPVTTRRPSMLRQLMPRVGRFNRQSMWSKDLDHLGSYAYEMAQKELLHPAVRASANDGFQIIPRGSKDHARSAAFFVDSVVSNDDAMRAYAIGAAEGVVDGVPDSFAKWWDDVGSQMFFGAGIRREGTTSIMYFTTRDDFYKGLGMWYDALANNNPQVRSEIIEAVAAKRALRPKTARGMGDVFGWPQGGVGKLPTEVLADERIMKQIAAGKTPRHVTERIFSRMYELPAGNRAGNAYTEFFDETINEFVNAYDGQIITPRALVDEKLAADVIEAERILAEGGPAIEDLISQGWMTKGQLEIAAHSYAKKRTLGMMYQPGASSLLGRRGYARMAFPFGRAHTDFLSWYGRELTNGTWAAGWMNPNGPLQIGTRGIPLNLRLLARSSHVANQTNRQVNELQGQTIEGDVGGVGVNYKAWSPGEMIRRLTFLPHAFDHSMMVDLVPGMGPVPAGILHFLPGDNPIRQAANLVFPGQAFDPRQLKFDEFWQPMVPTVGNSLTAAGARGIEAVSAFGFGEQSQEVFNRVTVPRYRLYMKQVLGEWFSDPAKLEELFGSRLIDPGQGEQFTDFVGAVMEESMKRTSSENMLKFANGLTGGFFDVSLPDAPQVDSFGGLMDYVDLYAALGYMPADRVEDLKEAWAEIEDGGGSYELRADFMSKALDAVFSDSMPDIAKDRLIVMNGVGGVGNMLPNFVSMEVVTLGPDGLPVGNIQARANGSPIWPNDRDAAQSAGREAREKGWVTTKPVGQYVEEVAYRYARALSNVLKDMLRTRTGRTDSYVKKKQEGKSYTLNGTELRLLDAMGISIDKSGTLAELKASVDVYADVPRGSLVTSNVFLQNLNRASETSPLAATIVDMWDKTEKKYDEDGVDPWDWPEETKARFRRFMDAAILDAGDNGKLNLTVGNYTQHLQSILGDLDYEAPDPPALGGLEFRLDASRRNLRVIDGDTIMMTAGDGSETPIRLLGVNAPDLGQPGYEESYTDLRTLLDEASSITFGAFDLDRYGMVNFPDVDKDKYRMKLWLYVDGEPIWHPEVFSVRNPEGVELGGEYRPLPRPSGQEADSEST